MHYAMRDGKHRFCIISPLHKNVKYVEIKKNKLDLLGRYTVDVWSEVLTEHPHS